MMPITLSQPVALPALFTEKVLDNNSLIPCTFPPKSTFPSPPPKRYFPTTLPFQGAFRITPHKHLELVPDNLITFRILGKEQVRLQIELRGPILALSLRAGGKLPWAPIPGTR